MASYKTSCLCNGAFVFEYLSLVFVYQVEGMLLTFLYTNSKEVVFPTYFVDSPVTPQTEKFMNIMYRRFDELNAKYADPKRYG